MVGQLRLFEDSLHCDRCGTDSANAVEAWVHQDEHRRSAGLLNNKAREILRMVQGQTLVDKILIVLEAHEQVCQMGREAEARPVTVKALEMLLEGMVY